MGSLNPVNLLKKPKTPSIPIPPPPEAPPPQAAPATLADSTVQRAASNQRSRAAAAAASSGTVGQAGAGGLKSPPKTAGKTLLGE